MSYSSEVLADSPALYWKLDEASGTTAADSSGNGRSGLHTGGVTVNQASLLGDGTGKSAAYNGSTGYTARDAEAWMTSLGSFTIEARIRPASGDLTGTPIIAGRGGPGGLQMLLYLSGGKLACLAQINGAQKAITGGTSLVAGTDYTVSFKFDATTIKGFLNGVVDGALDVTGFLDGGGSTPFQVGRDSYPSGYFGGLIDEVSVTPSALSDARVLARHQAAIATASSPEGTLAASLPSLTATLAGTYVPPVRTGSLAATLPALTASLSGTYVPDPGAPVDGSLAATLPALAATIGGSYVAVSVVETDLTYANDGYNYTGLARVFYDPPVAEPPAHVRRTKVRRVHQSMPAPTLVDGRPT